MLGFIAGDIDFMASARYFHKFRRIPDSPKELGNRWGGKLNIQY